MNQIYYYDKKGRRYKGKERTCPTCGKKEIVRDSNNSKECQECQRPPAESEVTYVDSSGNKYPGRYKKCLGCGKGSIVRKTNKAEYCKKCIASRRKGSIKEGELFLTKKSGAKIRAYKIKCPECGKERMVRKDCFYLSDLCRSCSAKKNSIRLYKTGIKNFRKLAFKCYKSKCFICDEDDIKKLDVHHKDKDRNNNTYTNIAIVCKSCHVAIHWKIRKGVAPLESFEEVKKLKTPEFSPEGNIKT